MEKIQYAPVKGNGVGNETPYVFGSPYRRIRKAVADIEGESVTVYFVQTKHGKRAVTNFLPLDQFDGVFAQ